MTKQFLESCDWHTGLMKMGLVAGLWREVKLAGQVVSPCEHIVVVYGVPVNGRPAP